MGKRAKREERLEAAKSHRSGGVGRDWGRERRGGITREAAVPRERASAARVTAEK